MLTSAVLIAVDHVHGAELLRTPKVYNALITTDQNLIPSRAYPVIQPSIRNYYSPYDFSPYGFYDGFGFNTPPLISHYNGNRNGNGGEIASSQTAAAAAAAGAVAQGTTTSTNSIGSDRSFVVNRNPDNRNAIVNNEKSPIPLNEFGLPPSLIPIAPIAPLNQNQNPFDLPSYNYNSYPLYFDRFGGFQQGPYLPHFGNVPQNAYAAFGQPGAGAGFGNSAAGAGFGQPAAGAGFGNAAAGGGSTVTGSVAVADNGVGGDVVNHAQSAADIAHRSVIGLPGSTAGPLQTVNEEVAFNRDNFNGVNGFNGFNGYNGINGGAQNAGFAQGSSAHLVGGDGGDGQASAAQSTFRQSSSSSATVSSASEGSGIAQNSGNFRNGRIFYYNDDIRNSKKQNDNLVAAPSPTPALRYGGRSNEEQ